MYCRRLLLTATFPSLSSCFTSNIIHSTFKHYPFNTKHTWLHHRIKYSLHQLSNKEDDNEAILSISNNRNIYQTWTIEDDRLLLKNSDKSIPYLASLLNRGLQGVKARLSKLNDVNNPAYIRLFAEQQNNTNDTKENPTKSKLIPVGEVLRRLKWDTTFTQSDFTVGYYDRIQNTIHESKMDATNDSIKGKEPLFVFALPEHRIEYVKYKNRIVWDKESRIELVFGSSTNNENDEPQEDIYSVIDTYEEWERKEEELRVLTSEKEKYVTNQLKLLLGEDRFIGFKEFSFQLQEKYEELQALQGDADNVILPKSELEKFTQRIVSMYNDAMIEIANDEEYGYLHLNENEHSFPKTEAEFLDLVSELVSFLPNIKLREQILTEIEASVLKLDNAKEKTVTKATTALPKLNEDDLEESFIRGSGAGGQKINKTSNKVLLIHKPTNIRVECQDTRSLSQNRKIARKRLQLKIEEYMLGSESRVMKKAARNVEKKAKSKARSKARLKKKQEAKALVKQEQESIDDEYPL